MEVTVTLAPIDRGGVPRGYVGELSPLAATVCKATDALYDDVGFEEPWIGYLALSAAGPVGTCAFKSAPRHGRVEIAYFTFPQFEARGWATVMARALISLARRCDATVLVTAQTLPERNPSHRVLEKLGFRLVAAVEHPQEGRCWEWHLPGEAAT